MPRESEIHEQQAELGLELTGDAPVRYDRVLERLRAAGFTRTADALALYELEFARYKSSTLPPLVEELEELLRRLP